MELLKLKEHIKYRSETFGGLIFDPNRSAILELNAEGLDIVKMLKDGISKKKLKKKVSTKQYQSIEKFLDILRRLGLLKEEAQDEKNG